MIRDALMRRAGEEGFDAVGIAPADGLAPEVAQRLRDFLAQGLQGDMDWMADPEKSARRADPKTLWPAARSVVMLGMNYGPAHDPLAVLAQKDRAAFSCYAQGRDYHDVIKKKLKALGGWLHQTTGAAVKVFVDTAPLMEKPLAARAGIGWQGKHTNLVSRGFGSWLFLGAILTELDLPSDEAESDHCGSCRACLDACPTNAFPAPYKLDARRCISYLTIEHKGVIAREFRAAIGNRVYGCDDCLAVCPWNKYAQTARETAFHPRAALEGPLLEELATLDDAGFRALFAGSPIKRIGRNRFMRNLAIALGNSKDPKAVAVLQNLLQEESALVRGMAVWGLKQLLPHAEWQAMTAALLAEEKDPIVRDELLD